MNAKKLGILLLGLILAGSTIFGLYFLYRVDHPRILKSLPDPFTFEDGTRVQTASDWELRRKEIKKQLLDIEYGHLPDQPDALLATVRSTKLRGDGSTLKHVVLSVIPSSNDPEQAFNFSLSLYVPPGNGPFPAIVKVSPDGTGNQEEINKTVVGRGYILAC